jgi:hypothetical protein
VLEADDNVISIPHEDRVARGRVPSPASGPEVEHVMQVDDPCPVPFSLTVTTPFSRKSADFALASSSVSVTSPPTGTTWNSMNRVSPFRPSAALFAPGPNQDALGLERLMLVEL